MRAWLGALLLVPGALAAADARDDYGWGWPLQLEPPGRSVYRIELTRPVYAQARDRRLGDVNVIDAAGEPVPAALLARGELRPERVVRRELPWYRVPPPAAAADSGWRMRAQTNEQGRLVNVETEVTEEGARVPAATDILIDASGVSRPLRALLLDWPREVGGDLELTLDVATSQDLVSWRQRIDSARLIDLVNDDRRLTRNRIEIGGIRAPYWRLQPRDRGDELAVDAVIAEYSAASPDVDWEWVKLSGERQAGGNGASFVYELRGRFPVQRVTLQSGPGSAAQWIVYSRDSADQPWRRRAGPWVAYRVASVDGERRSGPRRIGAVTRDRFWRLTTGAEVRTAPELRLAYRPEVLVFLPNATPPFTLVAGSVRSERRSAPVQAVLASLRADRDTSWLPAPAQLGTMRTLAAERALERPEPGPDWRTWLLWAILVAGAGLVAGLAGYLLRQS